MVVDASASSIGREIAPWNAAGACRVTDPHAKVEPEMRTVRMQRSTLGGVKLARRTLLRSALAGLAAATLPRTARAAKPRMLIVGDSMIAGAFGLFLERALRRRFDLTVHRRGKSSTGLARPDFFDWHEEAERLVADFEPDVTVVMFGGNDVQGLRMPDRGWIRWHEPEWKYEYAARVAAFCDILAPARQQIFWVGMPVMRPPKFHHRVQRVNTIYRAELALRRNAYFVDIWSLFADGHGHYADRVEVANKGRVRVRAGDGIHLTVAGAHHLKNHVLDELAVKLELVANG